MIFSPITSKQDSAAALIYSAYIEAFPEHERRSKEQYDALFDHPKVEVCAIIKDDQAIGYVVIWKLNGCTYLEHFEVFPEFRNYKYGSSIIQNLILLYPQLVLEAEPNSLDEMAARRIAFYERNGFTIIDKDYIQPSYGPGKSSMNLYVLATWIPEDIDAITTEIKSVVYNA